MALALYVVVLVRARDVGRRAALWTIGGLHLLFLLAPPLLSQDVFSYIAYARLGVEHSLDPYTHAPVDIPNDAVYPFAGSKTAESVYGPAFTLLTYPLAPLGVAGAYWVLKVIAALSSLGIVALVWRAAQRLGRDPLPAALFVGLNPLLLVHDVAGAHNETLVVLLTTAGLLAWAAGSPRAATAWSMAAAGLKASAGLVVPFLVAAARPRWAAALGAAVAVGVGIVVLALAGFGTNALDALGVLSSNQDRTSSWSFPYKTAELLGALLPGDRLDYREATRAAYGARLRRRVPLVAAADVARSEPDRDGGLGDARDPDRLGVARALVHPVAAAPRRPGGRSPADRGHGRPVRLDAADRDTTRLTWPSAT